MTTVVYWDAEEQTQKERQMTPQEEAELSSPYIPTEKDYIEALDKFLNAGAKIRDYDNIINASLRAGYAGPFQEEGIQYATWMDNVWAFAIDYLGQVRRAEVPQPTVAAFIAMLTPCPVTPREI